MVTFYDPPTAKGLPTISQAAEVTSGERTLYISGQIGMRDDHTIPDDFSEQATIVMDRLRDIAAAAGMDFSNTVKITAYLASPEHYRAFAEIRKSYLGEHKPAATTVTSELIVPGLLLEVEAVLAK